jgi:hypothetical protein
MKIIKIDASNRRNVKLTFDTEIETINAIRYVANIYREISGDESIKVQRPGDVVRDNDGRYAIFDNSPRCSLFEMGAIVKRSASGVRP